MHILSHIAAALFFALSGSGLLVGAGALAKCAPDIAKKTPSDERPPITAPDDGKQFKSSFLGELWRAEKERAVITRRCVIGSGPKGCAEICKEILAEDSCNCAKCDCQENKDRCEKFFNQHRTAPLPDSVFDALEGWPVRFGGRFCAKGENCEPESEDNQGEENRRRQEFLKCALRDGGMGAAAGGNTECVPPRRRLSPWNPAKDLIRQNPMAEYWESRPRQTLHANSGRIPFLRLLPAELPDGAALYKAERYEPVYVRRGLRLYKTIRRHPSDDDLDELDEFDEAGEYSTE